jgi:predicted transposase/invertase (TIGR01784 family)
MEEPIMDPQPLLKPSSDYIFKKIFGDETNINVLKSFLKTVLNLSDKDLSKVSLLDTHLLGEDVKDKLSILDVLVETSTGEQIDIEIQVKDMRELEGRVVYYNSKMFSRQLGPGHEYDELKRAVSILITGDFTIIKSDEQPDHRFRLYDPKAAYELTDIIEIDTLELPKANAVGDGTALGDWLAFLKVKSREELEMVEEKAIVPEVKQAGVILVRLSADEQVRMEEEYREKARRDDYARMQFAKMEGKMEGKVEGKAEGVQQNKEDTATNMLNEGLAESLIAKVTGLSLEKIAELKAAAR